MIDISVLNVESVDRNSQVVCEARWIGSKKMQCNLSKMRKKWSKLSNGNFSLIEAERTVEKVHMLFDEKLKGPQNKELHCDILLNTHTKDERCQFSLYVNPESNLKPTQLHFQLDKLLHLSLEAEIQTVYTIKTVYHENLKLTETTKKSIPIHYNPSNVNQCKLVLQNDSDKLKAVLNYKTFYQI